MLTAPPEKMEQRNLSSYRILPVFSLLTKCSRLAGLGTSLAVYQFQKGHLEYALSPWFF
jgi:hypothetical protein